MEVRALAVRKAPVLIQGESGTGKDVVAKALHQLSGRTGAYIPLNAGAIAESLSDAELFGYRRGAFTGAVAPHAGAFEQAHAGTLFLDEIAELSAQTQVKLLRVVEDKCVRPLGSTTTVQVDVRLVSASWAVLAERVSEGRFRADLYHRLATFVLQLPPLRERKSDLPALARALLTRMRDEVGFKELDGGALGLLASYSWPGNVRELSSVLYRAAVASSATVLEAHHITLPAGRARNVIPERPASDVAMLLERFGGNISAAARAARVPRSTFRAWLARAGIKADAIRTGRSG
jgi:two-component system response regulator PilR (NtrC family)